MAICVTVDKEISFPTTESGVSTPEGMWGVTETIVTNKSETQNALVEFYTGQTVDRTSFLGRYELKPIPDPEQSIPFKGFLKPNETIYIRLISGNVQVRSTAILDQVSDGKNGTLGYTKKEVNDIITQLRTELIKAIETGTIPIEPELPGPIVNNPTKPNIGELVHNVPNVLDEGINFNLILTGVTDPGNGMVRYRISNITGGLVFTKTQGILPNEQVTMLVPMVDVNTNASFDLIAISTNSIASDPVKISTIIRDLTIRLTPPNLISATSTLPSTINENSSITVAFNNITDNYGNEIKLDLQVTGPITLSKTTNLTVGEVVSLTTGNITANTQATIKLIAKNTAGQTDKTFFTEVIAKDSLPPVVSNLTSNIPSQLEYGKTYSVNFDNATDPEGDVFSLKLTNLQGVSFDATTDIKLKNNIIMTTTTNTSMSSVSFNVVGVDITGSQSQPKTFTFPIKATTNEPPNLGFMTTTLPEAVQSGASINVSFSGITDPNNDAITLSLSGDAAVRFSKTSGITVGEIIVFNAPTVTGDSNLFLPLTLTATDAKGATATKTYNIAIVK